MLEGEPHARFDEGDEIFIRLLYHRAIWKVSHWLTLSRKVSFESIVSSGDWIIIEAEKEVRIMQSLRIGENIVRLRHEKKITQEQLAAFIGVTKASVSKWENGVSQTKGY